MAGLDKVEGHSELVSLARDCLQLHPGQRPQDAGQVARRVSRYQERLEHERKKAEFAAVEAQLVAKEERKRRRILTAAATCAFVACCVGGWLIWRLAWQLKQNAELHEQVVDVTATEGYRVQTVGAYLEYESGRIEQARQMLELAPRQRRNWEWHYLNDQVDQSVLRIPTEEDTIDHVGFIEGTDWIAAVFNNNVAHIWNRQSGQHVKSSSPGAGTALAIASTGRFALSVLDDSGDFVLWDTTTGDTLCRTPGVESGIRYGAVAHDGLRFAIQTRDLLYVYSAQLSECIRTSEGSGPPVFVREENWLVSLGQDAFHFWDLDDSSNPRPPVHHGDFDNVRLYAVDRFGKLLAAQVDYYVIRVWDLATGLHRDLNISERGRRPMGGFYIRRNRNTSRGIDNRCRSGALESSLRRIARYVQIRGRADLLDSRCDL